MSKRVEWDGMHKEDGIDLLASEMNETTSGVGIMRGLPFKSNRQSEDTTS